MRTGEQRALLPDAGAHRGYHGVIYWLHSLANTDNITQPLSSGFMVDAHLIARKTQAWRSPLNSKPETLKIPFSILAETAELSKGRFCTL